MSNKFKPIYEYQVKEDIFCCIKIINSNLVYRQEEELYFEIRDLKQKSNQQLD